MRLAGRHHLLGVEAGVCSQHYLALPPPPNPGQGLTPKLPAPRPELALPLAAGVDYLSARRDYRQQRVVAACADR